MVNLWVVLLCLITEQLFILMPSVLPILKLKKKPLATQSNRIGSISKMFTATLVLKAMEENKIKLEANY